jgi:predicted short-subunit dehydrogenase-like oxidoreductase (DUF2520 family)
VSKRPSVAIIGTGRAGGAIGLALQRAGYDVTAAWSRSRAGRQRAARLLGAPVLGNPADAAGAGDIAILAVPDDAIEETARGCADGMRRGQYLVHTSGSVSITALDAARERGARTGSLHPLQTLPEARRGADALAGAGVAVTCAPSDRSYLRRLASAWGGRPFDLADDAKPVYHAAAVLASNLVVGVLAAAERLLDGVGVRSPRELMSPLSETAVRNALERGPGAALTGPVVRGDLGVLRRHVDALTALPGGEATLELYRSATILLAQLAGTDVDAVRAAIA